MFNIGDTVLCVDATIKLGMEEFVSEVYLNWVKEGQEYTVRGFADNDGIVTGMWLEEIHNIPIYVDLIKRVQEPCFRLDRFVKRESAVAYAYAEEEEYLKLVV